LAVLIERLVRGKLPR